MRVCVALAMSLAIWQPVLAGMAMVDLENVSLLENQMRIIRGDIVDDGKSDEYPPPKCGTPTALGLFALLQKSDYNAPSLLLLRPTDLPDTFGTGRFLIHYTTEGPNAVYQADLDTLPADSIPDFVNDLGDIFEYAADFLTDSLGYQNAPADFGQGSDNRYDIYVKNLGFGYLAYTEPESLIDGYRATSYITIENDFAESNRYRDRPLEGVNIAFAHSFFHAIQFGYDAFEFDAVRPGDPSSYKPWWMEASATWVEDIVFDDINDYLGYLPFFYRYPWIGLGAFSYGSDVRAFHPYASCVWPMFLTEKFDQNVVREIWEICGSVGGHNTLTAIDSALALRGSSLNNALLEFAVWNFHTGELADTARFYEEGAMFPSAETSAYIPNLPMFPSFDLSNVQNPPEPLAANYIVMNSMVGRGGIEVQFDGSDLPSNGWYVSLLGYLPGNSTWFDIGVNPQNGVGNGYWYNWHDQDALVLIPTVSGVVPGYDSYPYGGHVVFDSTLVPVEDSPGPLPFDIILSAYPNPFNSRTTITVSGMEEAEIAIYDITGRRLALLEAEGGRAAWEAGDVPSGVYLARVVGRGTYKALRLVLLK